MGDQDKQMDYDNALFHVERRAGLHASLREHLPVLPEGFTRNNFSGEAQFWMQIHSGLLRTSATLPAWCEQSLTHDNEEMLEKTATRITRLSAQLISHAHGHHHIEDEHFFPVFLARFPDLARPLELLDKDHGILSMVLDDMETATTSIHSQLQAPLAGASRKDALRFGLENLLAASGRLDRLFIRHIGDEEEICLPTLARLEGRI